MLRPSSVGKRCSVGVPHHLLFDHHITPLATSQSLGLETLLSSIYPASHSRTPLPKCSLHHFSPTLPKLLPTPETLNSTYMSRSRLAQLHIASFIPKLQHDQFHTGIFHFRLHARVRAASTTFPQSFSFSVSSNPTQSFMTQASPPHMQPFLIGILLFSELLFYLYQPYQPPHWTPGLQVVFIAFQWSTHGQLVLFTYHNRRYLKNRKYAHIYSSISWKVSSHVI